MAGISTKDLKTRIRSMESTRQITKAMEMVAASKLRGAQDRAQSSRPYFETLYAAMSDLAACRPDDPSPFAEVRDTGAVLAIVIAGDRGLAGGYNANVLKAVVQELDGTEAAVVPIGKKAAEYFQSRRVPILTAEYTEAAALSVGDCFTLARLLSEAFLQGAYRRVILGYTNFVSVLNQSPAVLELLPLAPVRGAAAPATR